MIPRALVAAWLAATGVAQADDPSVLPAVEFSGGARQAAALTLVDADPQAPGGRMWRVVVVSGQSEISGTITSVAPGTRPRLLVLRVGE